MEKPSAGVKELQGKGPLIDFHNIKLPSKDSEEILDGETFLIEAKQIVLNSLLQETLEVNGKLFYLELEECLLNLLSLEVMDNPITINNIVNHQSTDLPLLNKIITEPHNYRHEEMEGYKVVHTHSFKDGIEMWKIAIPQTLLPQLLNWYHLVLGHCGQQRLYNTVKAQFHSVNLQKHCVTTVKQCPQRCQLNKHKAIKIMVTFPTDSRTVSL